MTAFEIHLNNFYDTLAKNEPKKVINQVEERTSSLSHLMRKYIDTSFAHGGNLNYKNELSELLAKSAIELQNSTPQEWNRLMYLFVKNDLHIIRRDRKKQEVANLKMVLDRVL